MKKLLNMVLLVLAFGFANAQNGTEAKMAYQMAEEKFANKEYTKALAFLKEAEAALGSINPPMAYLKVMILNEMVYKKESADTYNLLNKAIANFEEHPKKDALGEDKLMEVYRIKNRIKERMPVFIEEQVRLVALKKSYKEMVLRLASEFPKTETTVMELVHSVESKKWDPIGWGYNKKFTDKNVAKFINNQDLFLMLSTSYEEGRFSVRNFSIHKLGEDRVERYCVWKMVKQHNKEKNNVKRAVTVSEICDILKISPQQWNDFTTGPKPLVSKLSSDNYHILAVVEQNGEYDTLSMVIGETTTSLYKNEYIEINIFENTF